MSTFPRTNMEPPPGPYIDFCHSKRVLLGAPRSMGRDAISCCAGLWDEGLGFRVWGPGQSWEYAGPCEDHVGLMSKRRGKVVCKGNWEFRNMGVAPVYPQIL